VKYDHIVVNDELDRAVREVRELVGLDAPVRR
jgi:guanylate kinase